MRRIHLVPMVLLLTAGFASAQKNETNGASQSQPSESNKYVPPTHVGGEDLDVWIKKLSHRDPAVRQEAVSTLPIFGPPAAKAVPKIVDMLGDTDTSVRLAALYILSSNPIDDPAQLKEFIARLESLLSYEQASVRVQAALAAARIGPVAAKVIPKLLSDYMMIRNARSYEVRMAAVFALGRVAYDKTNGPEPKVLNALLLSLSDDSAAVRAEAIEALVNLGRPINDKDWLHEKKVINEKLTTERNEMHALWLRVLMMRLDPSLITENYLKPIAEALNSEDHRVRSTAVKILWIMGKDAKSQAGALRAGFKFDKSDKPEDLDFMAWCISAIGRMGTEAAFMAVELKPFAAHKNEQIQWYAKQALEQVQPKAKN